jgi:hypothetical protein
MICNAAELDAQTCGLPTTGARVAGQPLQNAYIHAHANTRAALAVVRALQPPRRVDPPLRQRHQPVRARVGKHAPGAAAVGLWLPPYHKGLFRVADSVQGMMEMRERDEGGRGIEFYHTGCDATIKREQKTAARTCSSRTNRVGAVLSRSAVNATAHQHAL